MANKFQKSVLERLEQEATRQKKKSKSKAPETLPIKGPVVQVEEMKAVQTIVTAELKEPVIPQEAAPEILDIQEPTPKKELTVLPDIGEYLRRDNLRLAKNKTFYLDNDVIEEIKNTAKAQQVTDSKLVNDILRRVLRLS